MVTRKVMRSSCRMINLLTECFNITQHWWFFPLMTDICVTLLGFQMMVHALKSKFAVPQPFLKFDFNAFDWAGSSKRMHRSIQSKYRNIWFRQSSGADQSVNTGININGCPYWFITSFPFYENQKINHYILTAHCQISMGGQLLRWLHGYTNGLFS